ncbi:hypothetical protein [Hymenobacter glacieicola]|uniref:Peptidase S24/S26A/S26B/S26C domain-containing protein n=1 Tax=Hymenobacter glacieicola TaxID=1562124 RepID=A0ABQ1X5J5_9BACT|nr:hypothetical protein [Hymenobacter glacieicola]GGG60896.1 hypothetical protein GCM10011378_41130 [Hymenobacter glacieicola]
MTTCEEIPRFRLPLPGGTGLLRAFEIREDAMPPYGCGSVLVGRYVDNWQLLPDGTPCIVVSETEGIQFRRVFNRLKTEAALDLRADNPAYLAELLPVEQVLEVWEAAAYISPVSPLAAHPINRLLGVVRELTNTPATLVSA